ncbi:pentatricopeptide repeat-containing protein At4g13650-like [Malania oleifera]|uniref:pentatricopeptide repeat-containing protein At4g13650-like n=1 Tax=Malania oleifera TaxID=397392 RepID=UPI0025ADC310|nr:pentatricopeptide repeat-containing protein At4g13650-like [Malania oleifera]XP_057984194.1 pentatricopeptide repeat-containing protein At4g13650-like [Malania oleifera]XP_057984202.1 pentatricopeptide repeat-containing protein At4g13650-like [Malania oleifera]XP_057984210.1 pentatricopeptide repeat-containing protein At4g13650-like [Malania oleifera]XP_057984216.1 pentatricopeptide repeat-containing protein At4g13650-like [Malania oleifera]
MLENSVVKWTSKISIHARKGLSDAALSLFLQMIRAGVEPNETTFSTAIGASTRSMSITFGTSLHCLILKKGFMEHLFVATRLITMYSKHGYTAESCRVFDSMLVRDGASWNSMIAGYVQNGFNVEACNLFYNMIKGCEKWFSFVDNFTLASILKACAGLGGCRTGKSVHGYATKLCFDSDIFVSGAIIDMYSKCGNLDIARLVFDRMGNRDLVVWNTMIAGYAQNCCEEKAIELFYQLKNESFLPNEMTYSSVLKASSGMLDSGLGRCFHAKTLKLGFLLDVFIGTALVDMYSKFFDMGDAEWAFGEMKKRNLITYNALITGYGLTGGHEKALIAYMELQNVGIKPDSFTFMALFSSCSVSGAVAEGAQVHCHSIMFGLESDVFVGNSIMNFYFKCGFVNCALKAFDSIYAPNAISWAGIISGFVQNGDGEKALDCFRQMHRLSEITDEFSSSSALKVIISWASIELGRHLHAHVLKSGLQHTVIVGSSLIDMYSKCGMVGDAYKVFFEMPEKNVVSWNSLITGYAHNGLCLEALLLFQELENSGILPTSVTFVGVLFACSHAGLVEEGRNYYKSMVHDYGIPPSIEHCTCMVDLLGRAGYLDEAETFLLNSPFSKEPEIWVSLLAACGFHKNSDVGSRAAQHCLSLQPRDSSTYAILSNIYASKELWCEVTKIRDLMKAIGVEKESGCSWIEVKNSVNPLGDRFVLYQGKYWCPEELSRTAKTA